MTQDITEMLYQACVAVVDWAALHYDEDGRNVCRVCAARGVRFDRIRHADNCPVGQAWAAMIRYKSVEPTK